MLKHDFTGPPFTIGVEEELMILDAEGLDLAQRIEAVLDAVPERLEGQVKPELMQSVLEVATEPCPDVRTAGEQLGVLRGEVAAIGERLGLRIGASGTHPFARWEEQEIVDRPRYRELIDELGYVARQELIFGTHVHVAISGPNKAIYVADGIRRYIPVLLALSANSPPQRGVGGQREQHGDVAADPVRDVDRLVRAADRDVDVGAEDQLLAGDVAELVDQLPVAC